MIVSIFVLVRAPASASASASQVSIIQDSARLLADPAGTLTTFRGLGVQTVRVIVGWAQIAPDWEPARRRVPSTPPTRPTTRRRTGRPTTRSSSKPVRTGIAVDFTLSGGAPRWAEGPGIPLAALDNQYWAWRPSATAFGQFVQAVGERYSGTYVPPGRPRRCRA